MRGSECARKSTYHGSLGRTKLFWRPNKQQQAMISERLGVRRTVRGEMPISLVLNLSRRGQMKKAPFWRAKPLEYS